MSQPFWPILSSTRPTLYPGRSLVSSMMIEIPFEPFVGSVFATTPTSPACSPFEMKVFEPFST